MTTHLYMFKASGLQRYIFRSGRLVDVVGASQSVVDLTQEHLRTTLAALSIPSGNVRFVQRAAGAFTALFDDPDHARALFEVWPFVVSQLAPGIETDQWLSDTSKGFFPTLKEGWKALRRARNLRRPSLPELAPPVIRTPRTGGPAVASDAKDRYLDRAMARARDVAREAGGAAAGVAPGDVHRHWSDCDWAGDLSDIAGGQKDYLAVVHADGNRLGQFFQRLAARVESSSLPPEAIVDLYATLSEGIVTATREAIVAALQNVNMKSGVANARPVVVGGDDVTVILSADRGFEFARAFVESFESKTAGMLGEVKSKWNLELPETGSRKGGLTACAGVVFQPTKHPLLDGYEASEALCSKAKLHSGSESGTASSIAFGRVGTARSERTDGGPYATQPSDRLVAATGLLSLRDLLPRLSSTSIRGVVDALEFDRREAQLRLDRLLSISDTNGVVAQRLASMERQTGIDPTVLLADAATLHEMRTEER